MIGWLRIYRQLLNWEWYNDANAFRLFMHLLLTANYEPKRWQGIEIQSGQVVTGRKKLAKELGLSERNIRTSIERLKSTNEIAIKSTSKYSIITICKWEDYQGDGNSKRPTKRPATRPTGDQQTTTTKEIEEIKKNVSSKFDEFWNLYDKKTGKEKALKQWMGLTNNDILKILDHVPLYKISKPEKQYRKDPERYLKNRCWEDEVITPNPINETPHPQLSSIKKDY